MTRIDKHMVIELFRQGLPVKEIGERLNVTAQAISYHTSILKKRQSGLERDRIYNKGILTDGERKLLVMMANGLSSKDIAQETHHTYRTIDRYRRNMIRKVGVLNSCQLIAWGFKNKYLI